MSDRACGCGAGGERGLIVHRTDVALQYCIIGPREFPRGFPGYTHFSLTQQNHNNRSMEKPTYYVYYSSTFSFSPKEKKALYDLYGRDFFSKGTYKIMRIHLYGEIKVD